MSSNIFLLVLTPVLSDSSLEIHPRWLFFHPPKLSSYSSSLPSKKCHQELTLHSHCLPLTLFPVPCYPHPESRQACTHHLSLLPLLHLSIPPLLQSLQTLKRLVPPALSCSALTDPPVFHSPPLHSFLLHQAPLAVSPKGRRGQLFWLVGFRPFPSPLALLQDLSHSSFSQGND